MYSSCIFRASDFILKFLINFKFLYREKVKGPISFFYSGDPALLPLFIEDAVFLLWYILDNFVKYQVAEILSIHVWVFSFLQFNFGSSLVPWCFYHCSSVLQHEIWYDVQPLSPPPSVVLFARMFWQSVIFCYDIRFFG